MTHLLKRQQNLDKLRRQKEDEQYVRASRYDSTYREPKYAMDDVTAKKTFSGFAFTDLWTRTIKRSFYLQSEVNVDGSYSIWPTKEKRRLKYAIPKYTLQVQIVNFLLELILIG